MLLPEKMSDILTGPMYAARHPIDSAKLLGRGMQDASQYQFEKMLNAPSTSEAIGHGLAGAIPMLGPAAGIVGEEIGAGNTARGMGMATALLAPSLYRGGKAGVKWTGEAADELMAPRRAAAEAMAKKLQEAREWEAFNRANPNAVTDAGKPSPYAPVQGQGSMAQLPGDPTGIGGSPLFDGLDRSTIVNWGDEAAAPAPTASALPSRRDALKAGGAAGLGAMLVPKLMEAPKAPIPLVDAAPVLGRGAPSALGREGFYRELKHRVTDYPDVDPIVTDINKLVARDPNADLVTLNYEGEPRRHFLTRAEYEHEGGRNVYKNVYSIPKSDNLKDALRRIVRDSKFQETYGSEDIKFDRVVHSEITPEAALRLNTIEKPKMALNILDKRGRPMREGLDVSVENIDQSGMNFYRAEDGGIYDAVYAVPKGSRKALSKFEREQLLDKGAVPIDAGEASKIVDVTGKHPYSKPRRPRPETQGISPRYSKRVSIRLLKDTMAEQIKENKRAAGLKPPPLLAKAPVLQDNPKLSRFDFLRGIDLKKKP